MKKLLMVGIVAAISVLCGYAKERTVDSSYRSGYTIGQTVAIVANECNIPDNVRKATAETVRDASRYFPAAGQTVSDAWRPVVDKHIKDLVAAGTVNSAQGELITAVFDSVVLRGADYMIVRLGVEDEKDLVCAAVSGFSTGFLEKFNDGCDNCHEDEGCDDCHDCTLGLSRVKFDMPTYRYLTNR